MTQNEFMERFAKRLNPSQKEAVQSVDGAVLLLAVPGSGKTTVLVTRLGYMVLCAGIQPEQILTMTYTVAATKEMGARFTKMFGTSYGKRMEFRTINGLSHKIIEYGSSILQKPAFALVDNEGEISKLIREIYQALNEDYPTDSTVRDIRTAITYIKNSMLTEQEIRELDTDVKNLPEIYERYCKTLRDNRRMDFDDQMRYALTLLEKSPQILEYFQNRYPYICVDESQDTSRIQHEIIRKLAKRNGNLFMVGDEDQSIYGFRAAYPEALISFQDTYENSKVLLMEENYRSTEQIIALANDFVSRNRFRNEKKINPTCGSGEQVHKITVQGRADQYHYLFALAKKCHEETAVLYRNNDSAIPLIDMLERNGIAYNCRQFDEAFFSHKIVSDVTDIICFSYDPEDDGSFLRIYYKLGCPISKKLATYACERSRITGRPILAEMLRAPDLKPFQKDKIRSLEDSLSDIPKDSASQALLRIRYELGYGEFLEKNDMDAGKLTVLELVAKHTPDPKAFLDRMEALRQIIRSHVNQPENKLILSTIHSSKGLEYDRVYLLDVLDGILPSFTHKEAVSDKEIKVYEEDRRLFYVAMTRARRELHFFHSQMENSEFVEELLRVLPVESFEEDDFLSFLKKDLIGAPYHHSSYGKGKIIARNGDIFLIRFPEGRTELMTVGEMIAHREKNFVRPTPPKKTAARQEKKLRMRISSTAIQQGNRVSHLVFGMGTVIREDIEKMTIRFDKEGKERTFLKSAVLPTGKVRKLT